MIFTLHKVATWTAAAGTPLAAVGAAGTPGFESRQSRCTTRSWRRLMAMGNENAVRRPRPCWRANCRFHSHLSRHSGNESMNKRRS